MLYISKEVYDRKDFKRAIPLCNPVISIGWSMYRYLFASTAVSLYSKTFSPTLSDLRYCGWADAVGCWWMTSSLVEFLP